MVVGDVDMDDELSATNAWYHRQRRWTQPLLNHPLVLGVYEAFLFLSQLQVGISGTAVFVSSTLDLFQACRGSQNNIHVNCRFQYFSAEHCSVMI